jgi:hypothetical protein
MVRAENYDGRRVLSVREAWNLAAAYRMDTLTPFISLSQLRPLTPVSGTPVSQTTLAAKCAGTGVKTAGLKRSGIMCGREMIHSARYRRYSRDFERKTGECTRRGAEFRLFWSPACAAR